MGADVELGRSSKGVGTDGDQEGSNQAEGMGRAGTSRGRGGLCDLSWDSGPRDRAEGVGSWTSQRAAWELGGDRPRCTQGLCVHSPHNSCWQYGWLQSWC